LCRRRPPPPLRCLSSPVRQSQPIPTATLQSRRTPPSSLQYRRIARCPRCLTRRRRLPHCCLRQIRRPAPAASARPALRPAGSPAGRVCHSLRYPLSDPSHSSSHGRRCRHRASPQRRRPAAARAPPSFSMRLTTSFGPPPPATRPSRAASWPPPQRQPTCRRRRPPRCHPRRLRCLSRIPVQQAAPRRAAVVPPRAAQQPSARVLGFQFCPLGLLMSLSARALGAQRSALRCHLGGLRRSAPCWWSASSSLPAQVPPRPHRSRPPPLSSRVPHALTLPAAAPPGTGYGSPDTRQRPSNRRGAVALVRQLRLVSSRRRPAPSAVAPSAVGTFGAPAQAQGRNQGAPRVRPHHRPGLPHLGTHAQRIRCRAWI